MRRWRPWANVQKNSALLLSIVTQHFSDRVLPLKVRCIPHWLRLLFHFLTAFMKKEEPSSEPSSMLQFTCGLSFTCLNLKHALYRPVNVQMFGSGHPVPFAALWRWWKGAVGFLFQLACTEVNLTWLNTVMSHTKLLWPVLTQRDVCSAPCWLGTHISNKSDIHSLTTVTLTLHSWCVVQRFPRQTLPAATWNPGHNVALCCVISETFEAITGLSFISRRQAWSAVFKSN